MKVKLTGIVPESVIDGPGIRFVLLTKDNNELTYNREYSINELIEEFKCYAVSVTGITIKGGEPFNQPISLTKFIRKIKILCGRKYDIIAETNHSFSDIIKDKDKVKLVRNLDYIITEPFIKEEADLNLIYRKSTNQKIIDVKSTFTNNSVVEISDKELKKRHFRRGL